MAKYSVLLLMPLFVILTGCKAGKIARVADEGGASSLFEGFVYAGMDLAGQPDYATDRELPKPLSVGHTYVFHHEKPFDGVNFARKTLPERLRRLGYTVTDSIDDGQGPVSIEPVMIWDVKFARRQCRGVVFTRGTPGEFWDNRFAAEDFKLKLEGDCGAL